MLRAWFSFIITISNVFSAMDVSNAGRDAPIILRVGNHVLWTHPRPAAALTRSLQTLQSLLTENRL